MAEVRKVAESVFSKPADWPRNQRELAVDSVDRAYAAFMANPNARTREVLVATSSVFDYNRLGSRGAYRISAYEIRLLNTFWFCAKYYNFSSLLMFVYLVVAELSMMDRMIGIMSEGLQKDGMKYPPDDWQNYQYLHKPLWAYYMAYQDYRARKEGDFGSSIICVINQALEGVEDPCVAFDITKSLVVLISDMSCMLGWRREGMMRLSRKELSCLLAFEADLLRKTHQRPGERPLSSQLMIQISNYILKSRHGYNDDYICKYMWPENVCRALENGQVWMHDIEALNDPMEGRVIDELFGDSTWLGYEWAKDIDTRASRTYYVASFSKSMRNEEAAGRYGGCVFGYKGDRLVDMLAPIGDMTMYRREDANPTLPETRVHTSLTQVVAFDVLYDKDELKSELRYLCEIIDLFEMTSDEKHSFLESILQYWRYSAKVSDPRWVAEKERRYVLFTYPDVKYRETVYEDGYLKFKTTLYLFPDFILGGMPCRATLRARVDEKRHAVASGRYFFCHACLNRDYDIVDQDSNCCPVCGSKDFEIVGGGERKES